MAFQCNNMTILGPPGSGKGFYGRALASFLQIPFYTVSNVLRQNPELLDHMDSGALVDCQQVCNTLLDFLLSEEKIKQQTQRSQTRAPSFRFFLMDGFPRTRLQIELMQKQWPPRLHIDKAVLLDVPDSVCRAKMMGRRSCQHCNRFLNVASVDFDNFCLPAMLPPKGCRRPAAGEDMDEESDENNKDDDPAQHVCQDGVSWWTQRPDDTNPQIVQERLRLHREHEAPILEYYAQQTYGLFTYVPNRGVDNVPDMQTSLQAWLQQSQQS